MRKKRLSIAGLLLLTLPCWLQAQAQAPAAPSGKTQANQAAAPAVQVPVRPAGEAPVGVDTKKPVDLEADQAEESRAVALGLCTIRIQSSDVAKGRTAITAALHEVARVSAKYDPSGRDSEVSTINRDATREEVIVSEETYSLVQQALDLCRESGGALDPTVASYDYLWNFSNKPFVRPLPDEVAARRAMIGCKHLAIKPNRAVRLMANALRITLQPFARGLALDKAADVLRKQGIENFRILLGHDQYVQGRLGTRHWLATVPNPHNPQETLAQLYLGSQCAATRSDSDRVVNRGGKRYHDVIDPRTGQPAQGVASATVIGADPALITALAEAVFILGPKAGLQLLGHHKNVEGFVLDTTGKITATPGMSDYARLPAHANL